MTPINTIHFKSIDSTNEEARRRAESGLALPFIVTADVQTAGKGSHGRHWYSADSGGLYYSMAVSMGQLPSDAVTRLPVVVGEIVVKVIRNVAQLDVEMEWPNDIIYAHKKLGGMLIEVFTRPASDRERYAIIGIGLNINQQAFPEELAAIAGSIHQITHQDVDKDEIGCELTKELTDVFTRNPWRDDGRVKHRSGNINRN